MVPTDVIPASPPHALPPRNQTRMTDFHVELALAQDFCSYSHFLFFFRRAWFPMSQSPPHQPFLFKCGYAFLLQWPKRHGSEKNHISLFSPLSPCWVQMDRRTGAGILSEPVAPGALLKIEGSSVPPRWGGRGGNNKQFNFSKPCGAFSCGASLSCNSSQGGHLQQTAMPVLFLGVTCQCGRRL